MMHPAIVIFFKKPSFLTFYPGKYTLHIHLVRAGSSSKDDCYVPPGGLVFQQCQQFPQQFFFDKYISM